MRIRGIFLALAVIGFMQLVQQTLFVVKNDTTSFTYRPEAGQVAGVTTEADVPPPSPTPITVSSCQTQLQKKIEERYALYRVNLQHYDEAKQSLSQAGGNKGQIKQEEAALSQLEELDYQTYLRDVSTLEEESQKELGSTMCAW